MYIHTSSLSDIWVFGWADIFIDDLHGMGVALLLIVLFVSPMAYGARFGILHDEKVLGCIHTVDGIHCILRRKIRD